MAVCRLLYISFFSCYGVGVRLCSQDLSASQRFSSKLFSVVIKYQYNVTGLDSLQGNLLNLMHQIFGSPPKALRNKRDDIGCEVRRVDDDARGDGGGRRPIK